MFITAAAVLLFFHATPAALILFRLVEIHPCFLTHTVMDFHGNAGGNTHVQKGQYGKEEFFHGTKLVINPENCNLWLNINSQTTIEYQIG